MSKGKRQPRFHHSNKEGVFHAKEMGNADIRINPVASGGHLRFGRHQMKTKNTSPGNTSEGTIYIKGARLRSTQNYGGFEMVTLTQCDLKRTVQINDNARTYLVTPMA